ncbi:MAG: V-type ATPase subunit, partial [Clostridia bacterium]
MKEGVSYLYANSRASVLSTKLLTQDKFVRMAESENFAEALKVLTECNYGGVANESDLDKMLMEEEKSALDFFRDMITVEAIAKVFLLRYDYLNAKIAIKCKYLRLPMPNNLISGMFEASKLFSDIVKDDYDAFEIEMQSALNEIDNKFVDGDKSPMVIDLLCDKALYKNIARLSKDCKSAPIKEYLRRDADTVSLLSYYRAKNAKLDIQCFVNGGTLNQEAFLKVKGLSEVKQKDYFKQTPYYKLFL